MQILEKWQTCLLLMFDDRCSWSWLCFRLVVVMDLSMLKTFSGSAVAVQRQIRRHPCCLAEAVP